jgi:hypothetical protein
MESSLPGLGVYNGGVSFKFWYNYTVLCSWEIAAESENPRMRRKERRCEEDSRERREDKTFWRQTTALQREIELLQR